MDHKGSLQEVTGWGLIGWKYYANVIGPIQCEGLANVGVTQIACAEKRFLILSRNGHVYTQAYNSATLAPQLVQGLASRNIVKIAAHSDGHHCVALAATGEVYFWALGMADGWAMGTLWKKVIDVAAGSTHCLALTEDIQVHSSGSKDQCQHFDTLHVTKPEPAALPGLDTKHTVGIACGPAQFQAMT
ncbi:E3 ubiquitin-protein ligase HERC2-like isoform X2 [Macaca thibetana thibetana]|uniref:E3 ubiquitin-protein ligase HERC2-like isoform X2 n=1 Tax=Macaca thibetana thibetana TaxID=257877 RepID=UPI0021BCBEC7|nr:E3 ubiquitin-protein ligase HERC2-like isoform X2 [Macaca thibetana thibetana]